MTYWLANKQRRVYPLNLKGFLSRLLLVVVLNGGGAMAKSTTRTVANPAYAGVTTSTFRIQTKPKPKPVTQKGAQKKKSIPKATSTAIRPKSAKTRGKKGTVKKAASPVKKSPKTLNIPLYGPKYARVAVTDQALKGAIYYLSSGHGGPDPGAIGTYGKYRLAEDEYAYDVTIRLARVLLTHGATVYMIVQDPNDGIRDAGVLPMDRDEVAYPHQAIPLNQTARLRQGTMAVNNLAAHHKNAYQRSIIIHVDSRSVGQTIDVFFYHHDRNAAGKKLATRIHRVFTARYQRAQPGRGYLGKVSTRNSLYVIKNTKPPTVFIELGNIQNDKDQRRFVIADNRQALANWLYEGMLADYRAR